MTVPLRHCALATLLAVALMPAAAMAQFGPRSFYASVSGLYVIPTDSDVSETIEGITVSSSLKMDGGIGLLVAIGYGADVGLRGEVELGYRKAGLDKFDGLTVRAEGESLSLDGELSVDGDVNTMSLMANGIVAFEAWKLRPYIGVGIGLARHDGTFDEQTFTIGDTKYTTSKSSDDDIVIAYQGMAGVSYPMSEAAEVRLGYRYFATGDADFDGLKASYGTHNIEAGILFRF